MKFRQAIAAFAALIIAGAAAAADEHGDHSHEPRSAGEHGGHAHESSSVGQPGKAADVARTIHLDMADTMRFTPALIEVAQGETIRFVVKNSGQIKHEMVLGTPQELKEHYAMMLKMPNMEHTEDNMLTVAPGKTGELIWRFTRARVVDFACLQPGHYPAGMKGQVMVLQAASAPMHREHGGHAH